MAQDVIAALNLEVGEKLAQLLVKDLHGPEVGEIGGGCGFWEVSGKAGADLIVEDDRDRVRVCEHPVVEEIVMGEAWTTVDAD